MINVDTDMQRKIEEGSVGTGISYYAILYLKEPLTYHNVNVGDMTTSLSDKKNYEISNASISIENRDYAMSRLFAYEIPLGKLVEIYISPFDILVFRGFVNDIMLATLSANLNLTI